jgi:hypothetical protein
LHEVLRVLHRADDPVEVELKLAAELLKIGGDLFRHPAC